MVHRDVVLNPQRGTGVGGRNVLKKGRCDLKKFFYHFFARWCLVGVNFGHIGYMG